MEEDILAHMSILCDLLNSTYKATNITCQVLDASCYNYKNVLKRWLVPVEEEEYECTCKSYLDEPEDMVNDIGYALERAKATRKTVNQMKNVQFNKSSEANSTMKKGLEILPYKEQQKRKFCNSRTGGIEKDLVNHGGTKCSVAQKDRGDVGNVMRSQSRRSLNTKLNKSGPFQTTYQKDFSVRNLHPMAKTNTHKAKNIGSWDTSTSSTRLHCSPATVDINRLLEKVSVNSTPKISSGKKINLSQRTDVNKMCFMHGDIAPPTVWKCVELKEAMDLQGVPPELVKLLKVYHQYINVEHLQGKRKVNGRDSFLHKINESNQSSWDQAASEPVVELWLHHLLAFVKILSVNKKDLGEPLLTELEEEFEMLTRSFNKILDTDISLCENVLATKDKIDFTDPQDSPEKYHWAMAGIWNSKCWNTFSGLRNSLKISYSNEEDCILLQKRTLEIQKLNLQVHILEMIKKVFPLLNNLQDDHVALPPLYKLCSSLCNISRLSVPVIIKFKCH